MSQGFLICLTVLFVEAVSMDISPPSIILNYPSTDQPAKTVFRCRNPTVTDISYLSSLKISRLTRREAGGTPQLVVNIRQGGSPVIPTGKTDIRNRATAGGAIDKAAYNQAYVSLEFNTVDLQCDDVGQYFCELTYDDINLNQHIEESSMNFTASALPSDIFLIAKKDGFNIDGSQIFPAKMSVGQEIEFTCAGTIGGDPHTELQWAKTGNTGNFIKFQPQAYPGIATETQEPAFPVTGRCTNTRRATLKYNFTSTDKNSIGTLQFQCFVEVTLFLGGTPYRVNSTTIFHIEVEGTPLETSSTIPLPSEIPTEGKPLETSSTMPSPSEISTALFAAVVGTMGAIIFFLASALVVVVIMWRKPHCVKQKELRYEVPYRPNQSFEERAYASINPTNTDYENS